jgi:NAD(P)-dependent dehydrogenase (short-subunit alcohol dehydrogenase family)
MLHASGDARVVNCSSVLGFAALSFRGAYNATKFAMEGTTDTLRRESKRDPITYILIEPGPIGTRMRQNAAAQFERWIDWERSRKRRVYEKYMIPRLYSRDTARDRFERPPSAVTKKLIHALEAKRPRPRYFVTIPTYFAYLATRLLPTTWQDKVLR